MYVRSVFRGLSALVIATLMASPAAASTERALGTVTIPFNVASMSHDTTLPAFTMTIFPAPPSDVTLNIALGGTVGSEASIITSGLTFGPGVTARTFQLKSGSNLGTIDMTFSLSGTNAADYTLSKTTHTVQVIARFNFSPQSGPQFMNVFQGDTRTFTVTPSKPVLTNVTLSIGATGTGGYALNPAVLTFPAGTVAQTFSMKAMAPGTVTLNFTRGGADAARYGPPAPINFTVVAANTQPGEDVSVTIAPPPSTSIGSATVTFGTVTEAGMTRLFQVFSASPAPPSGFEAVPGMTLQFGAVTAAAVSAPVHVCPTYPANTTADETSLRIFKRLDTGWVDVTISNDTTSNVICAGVPTLEQSVFAIFRLNAAPVVGAITGPAGVIAPGTPVSFSATFTDADEGDEHTGMWVENGESIGEATITKVDGVFTATGELTFAGGVHNVYLVIKDGGQHAFSPEFEVVVDAGPPVIQSLTASPDSLWQPNSKMHDVVLTVAATDDSGTPVCTITGVSAAAQNVKQTAYVVTGPLTLQLKAFPHSVYTITVTCTDAVNRQTTKTVAVAVDKGR